MSHSFRFLQIHTIVLAKHIFLPEIKQQAKEHYERSLHLNPDNENARDALSKLQ